MCTVFIFLQINKISGFTPQIFQELIKNLYELRKKTMSGTQVGTQVCGNTGTHL